MAKTRLARQLEKSLYPELFKKHYIVQPVTGYTLREARLQPCHSRITPFQAVTESAIGPVKLYFPLLGAAMDAVCGKKMLIALSEVGACGIAYWDKDPEKQLGMIKEAIETAPFMVSEPKFVRPNDILENAKDILDEYGFSTIPVIEGNGVLIGIVFTRDVSFREHLSDPVTKWMMPFEKLKTEKNGTPLQKIRHRLLNEEHCNVLPLIDKDRKLIGMHFMKDFFVGQPSSHNSRPLVGMAIGINQSDLERVRHALILGVGIICIDSSHGNNDLVIRQAKKVVKMVDGRAAVIAGNVADLDGYIRLAETGVDAVKCGIGSGAICTTSQVTGAGYPMFTLLRELRYAQRYLKKNGKRHPSIIADGGIEGPGDLTITLAAGGNAGMAGKWLVSAWESESCQVHGINNGMVDYWGMASDRAIRKRRSVRYGKGKTAAEGVEGKVPYRGPLRTWFGKDIELVCGGLAHAGAKNIEQLHRFGDSHKAFVIFSAIGDSQNKTRVEV